MCIQSPSLGQRRLGRQLLSAGPVADTGRIARRRGADPTELNARTPPRARATVFTRVEVCPGWFVKTLDALLLPGENRCVKLPRLARAKGCSAASPAPHRRTGPAAAPRILAARPPAPGKPVPHVPVRPR